MSLDSIVIEKINQMMETGEIDAIVSKQVTDMLHSALRSVFSNHKGVGADIEQLITDSLKVKISNISVEQYTSLIAKIIETRVNSNLLDLSKETVEKSLNDILERAPERIKLSELVNKFKEANCYDGDEGEISLEIKEKDSYCEVIINKSEDEKYDQVSFCVNKDGTVFILRTGYLGKEPGFFAKENYGFDKVIMDIYCRGTKIDLDEDDCDLNYGPSY